MLPRLSLLTPRCLTDAMAAECIDLDKGKVTFAEASAAGAAFLESQRAFKQAQEAEQAAEAALRDAQQTRRAAHDALLEAKRRALRKYGAASGVVVEQSEWASMFSSASDAVQKTQAGDEAELAMSPAPSEGDAEDDVTEASSSQVASDAVSGAEEHEAVEEDSVGAGEDDRDEQPVQGQPRRSGSVRSSSSSSSAASESRQKRESEETAVPSKHPRAASECCDHMADFGA